MCPRNFIYVYVGETQSIVDHINNYEIGSHGVNDRRNTIIRNGDHKPFVFQNGEEILVNVNDSWSTDEVRIGEGVHFHNIIEGQEVSKYTDLAMFHIDAHPNTSMAGLAHHIGEWTVAQSGQWQNQFDAWVQSIFSGDQE